MGKTKSSEIWLHFSSDGICLYCSRAFKKDATSSTKTFWNHLIAKHFPHYQHTQHYRDNGDRHRTRSAEIAGGAINHDGHDARNVGDDASTSQGGGEHFVEDEYKQEPGDHDGLSAKRDHHHPESGDGEREAKALTNRSVVWRWCSKLSVDSVYCKAPTLVATETGSGSRVERECGEILPYRDASTKNLMDHLRRNHATIAHLLPSPVTSRRYRERQMRKGLWTASEEAEFLAASTSKSRNSRLPATVLSALANSGDVGAVPAISVMSCANGDDTSWHENADMVAASASCNALDVAVEDDHAASSTASCRNAGKRPDFGAVDLRSSFAGRAAHIVYASRRWPGEDLKFSNAMNTTNQNRQFYRCNACVSALRRVRRANPNIRIKMPTIVVENGRFLVDPDNPPTPHVCRENLIAALGGFTTTTTATPRKPMRPWWKARRIRATASTATAAGMQHRGKGLQGGLPCKTENANECSLIDGEDESNRLFYDDWPTTSEEIAGESGPRQMVIGASESPGFSSCYGGGRQAVMKIEQNDEVDECTTTSTFSASSGLVRSSPPSIVPATGDSGIIASVAGNRRQCPQCPSQFENLDLLRDHIAGDHLGYTPYRCVQCEFARFATEFAVIAHNRMAHGGGSFTLQKVMSDETRRIEDRIEQLVTQSKTTIASLRPP